MKKRLLLIVCSILFVGFIILPLFYMFLNPLQNEYFIFQNIEECEGLIPTDQSEINIDRYNTPNQDKDIKDLIYNDFWGMKFESNELEYEIFAYEFEDSDSALKYYVNVTGQNSYEKKLPLDEQKENNLLSAAKGITSYRIVVVSQNRAYKLISSSKYADEINRLLAEAFSQELS